MSRLMLRGGYGEHGRSCFLVEYGREGRLYMVDCGIMDTDPFPYPNVTAEELARVDYLFLTHCHKDHSGAFSYFTERGFCGTLVTTRMTCRLAEIVYEKTLFLEIEDGEISEIQVGSLTVHYGRTGHCPGGLWFEITDDVGDTILFSGDYQEDTLVYRCDLIRGSHAKLALLDCAHRGTEMNAHELREQIVQMVTKKIWEGRRVILPVPQYGRGLELLILMEREFPELRVRVDRDFAEYAEKMLAESVWYYNESYRKLMQKKFVVFDVDEAYDILILADTHLKKQSNQEFVHREIEAGAAVLINGRVKKNGPVGNLLDAGKAERFLYPHHQSYGDLKCVAAENHIATILPFHNNEKEVLV